MFFAQRIISWYKINGRSLPWRESSDPYIIWLSEIILQQTRVEQGLPYFLAFSNQFPTVKHFAEASEDEVLRLWQGLGYYSRARNMHKAAKIVLSQFDAIFPSSYSELIKLPGIGQYTASAISSFTRNEVKAVVDGNVYRVLARVFGIDTPINSSQGKKDFQVLADSLIDDARPGLFNQAIMDFGAINCKPKAPLCNDCIFESYCVAFDKNTTELLPTKIKNKTAKTRYFHYFVIKRGNEIMMSKRVEKDVWINLYEFPMIEYSSSLTGDDLIEEPIYQEYFGNVHPIQIGEELKQVLSHQIIYARFFLMPSSVRVRNKKITWEYVMSEKLNNLAKHKLIFSFLDKNNLAEEPKL